MTLLLVLSTVAFLLGLIVLVRTARRRAREATPQRRSSDGPLVHPGMQPTPAQVAAMGRAAASVAQAQEAMQRLGHAAARAAPAAQQFSTAASRAQARQQQARAATVPAPRPKPAAPSPAPARRQKAILFSGGLDSTCAAILNPAHQLIRVATGSKYDSVETVHAALIANAWGDRSLIEVDGVLDLGRYEQDDALVPARNALVALVAAQHASELTLVSVDGDGTHATDKDARFADIMSELLAKLFGEGSVVLPYRKWSKLHLLHAALEFDQEATLAALPHVWSCYNPVHVQQPGVPWSGTTQHCGQCKACVRLHGALAWANVLAHGPTFATNPFDMPLAKVREIYAGRGEEERLVLEVHRMGNRNPR